VRIESIPPRFRDRIQAGLLLGQRLSTLGLEHPVIVGLPRGGVPVAFEVARVLGAPLDILLVRKLGVPFHPELAFGAIGEDDVRVLNRDLVQRLGITDDEVVSVDKREREELARRVALYRDGRESVELLGRTVVVVDDGLATGATARAAIQVARSRGAGRVILAVPVAPPDTVEELSHYADDVISLLTPPSFQAVGEWYDRFDQTSDHEVTSLLREAAGPWSPADGDRAQ